MEVAHIVQQDVDGVGSSEQAKTMNDEIEYFTNIPLDKNQNADDIYNKVNAIDPDVVFISTFAPQLSTAPGKEVQIHDKCGQSVQTRKDEDGNKIFLCPNCDQQIEESELEDKQLPPGAIYKLAEEYPIAARISINEIELGLGTIIPQHRFTYADIKRAMRKIDVNIPSSEAQRRQLKAQGYHNTSQPVEPMIDLSRFAEYRQAQKPDLVSFISRVDPVKAPHLNWSVGEAVAQRVPSAQFWMCGTGMMHNSVQYYGQMNARNNRWRLMGCVEQEKIYSNSKVVVQMSLSENHSLTVLESRAAGIPVVCSDIQGHMGDVVKVGHERIEEAVDKIVRLLTDDAYYETKVKDGVKGLDRYNPSHVARKYDRIFKNMKELKGFKK